LFISSDELEGIPYPNFTLTVNFAIRSHLDHQEHRTLAYSIGFWFYVGNVQPCEQASFYFAQENTRIYFSTRGNYFFPPFIALGTVIIWAAGESEHATLLPHNLHNFAIIGGSLQFKKKLVITLQKIKPEI
jgi:hypothetical protein